MGVDGNDYENRFQSILRQRKNIDARVSADTNALFSEENYSIFLKEVKANTKAAQKAATRAAWISALPSIFSAVGTGAAAIANASARRRATTQSSSGQQSVDYTSMSDSDLAMKKAELTDKAYIYGQEAEAAGREVSDANVAKKEAQEAAGKATTDLNARRARLAVINGTGEDSISYYNGKISELDTQITNLTNDKDPETSQPVDHTTEIQQLNAQKQEYETKKQALEDEKQKLEADENNTESIKYSNKQLTDANKKYSDNMQKAIDKAKEQKAKTDAKEAAERDIRIIDAEIANRANKNKDSK
ncbi:hypothetical protein IKE67_06990 [bacterium]|nr:hypothetical protein [bacterium]